MKKGRIFAGLFFLFLGIAALGPRVYAAPVLTPSSGQTPITNVLYDEGTAPGYFIRISDPTEQTSAPTIGATLSDYCRSVNPETNIGFGSTYSSDCPWSNTGIWYVSEIQDGDGYVLSYTAYDTASSPTPATTTDYYDPYINPSNFLLEMIALWISIFLLILGISQLL